MIAKSTTIKERGGKSGGRAGKGRSYLGRSPACLGNRTERTARPVIATEKSADGKVGHGVGETSEALRTERRSNR
jgi:hypothetical protein